MWDIYIYRLVGDERVLEVYRLVGLMELEEDGEWDQGWNSILRLEFKQWKK